MQHSGWSSLVRGGLALGALLVLAGAWPAAADTLVFDGTQAAKVQAVANAVAPARLYPLPRPGTNPPVNDWVLRCRILDATPAMPPARPQLFVEAWWTPGPPAGSPPGTAVVFTVGPPGSGSPPTPSGAWISMDGVLSIEHDFDSHVDLQLMLSTRDSIVDNAGKNAPIGSLEWARRMNRYLDPGGQIGMAAGPAPPPETLNETRALRHRGWMLHTLRGDPVLSVTPMPLAPDPTPDPNDPSDSPARRQQMVTAFDAVMQARKQAYLNHVRTTGIDPLLPQVLERTPADGVRALITGIARLNKPEYAQLRQHQARDPAPYGAPALTPQNQNDPGVGTDLESRLVIAAGFMCTLSRVPDNTNGAPDPRTFVEPGGTRYQRYGREARDMVLVILEEAANPATSSSTMAMGPGTGTGTPPAPPGGPPPPPPPFALTVDEVDMARAALRVVQQFETYWLEETVEPFEGRRLVTALVQLAREVPAGDPRELLSSDARLTLIRLLRPDAHNVRNGANLISHAEVFRDHLRALVSHPDPAVREGVQTVLAHAAALDVASPQVIEDLFALATGEHQTDEPNRDVRRANRRYAITVLTLLGNLYNPRRPQQKTRDEVTGELVFDRLQKIRDAVETGEGSRGQAELVKLLVPSLADKVDATLKPRVERFLKLEAAHVQQQLTAAEERFDALRRRVNDETAAVSPEDAEDLRRANADVKRHRRRLASLSPNGQ